MTSEGFFILLQKQKLELNIDPSLVEAFVLTPEFLTAELLFNRTGAMVSKQKLVELLLEGNWDYLRKFAEQQKRLNDLSNARRQNFLLDYIKLKSGEAAYLLLELENDFAVMKLDDAQVIAVLQLLPTKTKESELFALALLTSPRSTSVWQQASLRLYEYAGEPIPKDWNYQTSLLRFAPDRIESVKLDPIIVSKDVKSIKGATETTSNISSSKKTTSVDKISKPNNVVKSTKSSENKSSDKVSNGKPSAKVSVGNTNSKNTVTNKTVVPKKTTTPYRLYIVQDGDSLWKISRRFGVDMEILKKHNDLKTNSIKPGTALKIP
ncbi:MAG: LysM peptidoglycan-binding domain-containing protein [Parachlamydiaceae bacterium]|nr:LysM peptidoglycan-binding domain-containing protein [Parachlamydiaceae bacterium]